MEIEAALTTVATISGQEQGDSLELGYLLLEDCEILLASSEHVGGALPLNEWIHVNVELAGHDSTDGDAVPGLATTTAETGRDTSSSTTADPNHRHPRQEQGEELNDGNHPDETRMPCRRCNLVVEQQQQQQGDDETNTIMRFQIDGTVQHAFWGTIEDLYCRECGGGRSTEHQHAPPRQEEQQQQQASKKRSDAALWMGLLVACRNVVSIETCRILWKSPQPEGSSYLNQGPHRATLLFTLTFPHLSQQQQQQPRSILQQPRSILPAPFTMKRTSRTASAPSCSGTKALHPALQLLLQLVRSDWDHLEVVQQQLLRVDKNGTPTATESNPQPRETLSGFFPTKLTLGEIYTHIQGSNFKDSDHRFLTEQQPTSTKRNENASIDTASYLTCLPMDLLAEKVAPFFDAKSLAAVRSCSQFLYRSLRHVVPGLKVSLYSHQIHSLSWMRRRESSLIGTEQDCCRLDGKDDTVARVVLCPDGDIHRSVSGGGTVRLASRRQSNRAMGVDDSGGPQIPPVVIRLDSCTGQEVTWSMERDGGSFLPRHVARGGLLCDEPGLGKSVSILSLILQTHGLSSSATVESTTRDDSSDKTGAKDSDETRTQDDVIFGTYWAEQIMPDFRRPYLNKLLNDLCRRHNRIRFSRVAVNNVKKAIDCDKFGGDFAAFEEAVK